MPHSDRPATEQPPREGQFTPDRAASATQLPSLQPRSRTGSGSSASRLGCARAGRVTRDRSQPEAQTTSSGSPKGRRNKARRGTPGLGCPAPCACTLKGCRRVSCGPSGRGDWGLRRGPGFHPGLGSCGPTGRRRSALPVRNPTVSRSRLGTRESPPLRSVIAVGPPRDFLTPRLPALRLGAPVDRPVDLPRIIPLPLPSPAN